jgi:hypothetical protein
MEYAVIEQLCGSEIIFEYRFDPRRFTLDDLQRLAQSTLRRRHPWADSVTITTPDGRQMTGRPLAHAAVADARVLRRRYQSIAHSSALTAANPPGRAFLTVAHVVFPVFTLDLGSRSSERVGNANRFGGPLREWRTEIGWMASKERDCLGESPASKRWVADEVVQTGPSFS